MVIANTDVVGNLMTDPDRRASWRQLVGALVEAHAGALSGFLFHGTTDVVASSISTKGVTVTDVLIRSAGHQQWVDGTYWATPAIAAYYAEDRIESTGDPDVDLAFVAVRLEDLQDAGELVQDEQSLDSPIVSRLGFDDEEVFRRYEEAEAVGMEPWQASIEATGSVVCLAPVPAGRISVIRTIGDIQVMLDVIETEAALGFRA